MYFKIGVFVYVLVLSITVSFRCEAQNIIAPFHQRIDLNDNMPSDVVYELAQSKKGTMWLASEKGLFSYSGFYFTSYQVEKSNYYTNDVIGVQIDYLNRPIAIDFSKYLLLIDEEKLVYKENSNTVPRLESYNYKVLNYKTHSLITDGKCLYTLTGTTFKKIATLTREINYKLQDCYKVTNGIVILYTNGQKLTYNLISKQATKSKFITRTSQHSLQVNNKVVDCSAESIHVTDSNGPQLFKTPVLKNNTSAPPFLYVTRKGNLVYGVVATYMFILDCSSAKSTIKWYYISDASKLSSLLVCNDGTIYISTLGDGMYKINSEWLNTRHITYNTHRKILYYSEVGEHEIALQENRIFLYKEGILHKKIDVSDNLLISEVVYLDGYYYASGFYHLFKIPKTYFESLSELNYATSTPFALTKTGCKSVKVYNNNIYYTTATNLVQYNPKNNKKDTLLNQRCEKQFVINNLLFVNTENHLKIYNRVAKNIYNLNIRARAITSKDSNFIFILSKTNDLYLLDLKNQKLQPIKTKLTKGIDDILWFKNYLYVCNATGINRLNYFAHNNTTSVAGTYEFKHYDMQLLAKNGTCILTSNRGVIATNIDDFFSRKIMPTYLAIESTSGVKKDNHIYLDKDNNQLTVNVVDENISSYKYVVIIGKDSTHHTSSSLNTGLLKEGISNISIVGVDRFENYTKPLNFRVHNAYPFFSSRLFKNLLISLVLSLLLFVVYSVYNYKIKIWDIETQNRNKEMETRLIALRSQMNPHFIYNVLNTAQSHMFTNNLASANNIITKLSGIIREVLESTKTRYIALEEEIKLITEYCELEKVRYDNKFEFEILVDKNLDLQQKIPYFFVQPLVENAIWHGLIKDIQNTNRKLLVTFSQMDKILNIKIEDNGVGYDPEKIRPDCVALNNLRERIAIKKQLRDIDATLSIYNKQSLNPSEKGTICELTILMPNTA